MAPRTSRPGTATPGPRHSEALGRASVTPPNLVDDPTEKSVGSVDDLDDCHPIEIDGSAHDVDPTELLGIHRASKPGLNQPIAFQQGVEQRPRAPRSVLVDNGADGFVIRSGLSASKPRLAGVEPLPRSTNSASASSTSRRRAFSISAPRGRAPHRDRPRLGQGLPRDPAACAPRLDGAELLDGLAEFRKRRSACSCSPRDPLGLELDLVPQGRELLDEPVEADFVVVLVREGLTHRASASAPQVVKPLAEAIQEDFLIEWGGHARSANERRASRGSRDATSRARRSAASASSESVVAV